MLTATLKSIPDVPLEAEVLSPDRLMGLTVEAAAALPVLYGNAKAELGEFFTITPNDRDELRLQGDLTRIKLIGAGMSRGRLVVEGNVGLHLGAGMTGGEILVEGDAADWVGPEMTGGRIEIRGNAGHAVGAAYRGSRIGMRGGEILVHGRAGNEVGNSLRNGLIAIGGDCGDFAGVNLLAGTIIVLGQIGLRSGAGMKRGTIVCMTQPEILPTFTYACRYQPDFLRLYLARLKAAGLAVTEQQAIGFYHRWSGDSVELNRGEILVYDGPPG